MNRVKLVVDYSAAQSHTKPRLEWCAAALAARICMQPAQHACFQLLGVVRCPVGRPAYTYVSTFIAVKTMHHLPKWWIKQRESAIYSRPLSLTHSLSRRKIVAGCALHAANLCLLDSRRMMARRGITHRNRNSKTKVAHLHSHSARPAPAKGARFISELCKL